MNPEEVIAALKEENAALKARIAESEQSRSEWSSDSFWQKTSEYMRRARQAFANNDEEMFGLWSHLALEFLAKSALAKKHPILLLDAKRSAVSVLYVGNKQLYTELKEVHFGVALSEIGLADKPRTDDINKIIGKIAAKWPQPFKPTLKEDCEALISVRNEELHGNTFAFRNLSRDSWLKKYFYVTKALLEILSKRVEDYWEEFTDVVKQQVEDIDQRITEEVEQLIKYHQTSFQKLDRKPGGGWTFANLNPPYTKIRCPACTSMAILRGKAISIRDDVADEVESIYGQRIYVWLPTYFYCDYCELVLDSNEKLRVAKIGNLRSMKDNVNFEEERMKAAEEAEWNNDIANVDSLGKDAAAKYLEEEKDQSVE